MTWQVNLIGQVQAVRAKAIAQLDAQARTYEGKEEGVEIEIVKTRLVIALDAFIAHDPTMCVKLEASGSHRASYGFSFNVNLVPVQVEINPLPEPAPVAVSTDAPTDAPPVDGPVDEPPPAPPEG